MITRLGIVLLLAVNLHAESTTPLVDALQNGKPDVQIKAADKLGSMGHDAADAWKPLVDCVIDAPQGVKVHAARALAKIGEPNCIPCLYAIANDKSQNVVLRAELQKAIASFGRLDDQHQRWAEHGREYVTVGDLLKNVPPLPLTSQSGRFQRLNIGTTGSWGQSRVVQVIDTDSVIVRIAFSTMDVMVIGYKTEGMIDGLSFEPHDEGVVVGTNTYTTITGASRTVPLIVPLKSARYGVSFEDFKAVQK